LHPQDFVFPVVKYEPTTALSTPQLQTHIHVVYFSYSAAWFKTDNSPNTSPVKSFFGFIMATLSRSGPSPVKIAGKLRNLTVVKRLRKEPDLERLALPELC
jgi:hypothetical protein